MDALCLTLDVDWAPEWMIDPIIDFLVDNQVKSTWFITHIGPHLDRLRAHPEWFEIGIHPNFNQGSTHGETIDGVLAHCLEIAPEAVSMRTHTLLTSGRILAAAAAIKQLQFDSSILLPKANCAPIVTQPFSSGHLTRIPFIWGDSLEMHYPPPNWRLDKYFNQVTFTPVLNFHPIHIHYNHSSLAHYQKNKQCLPAAESALRQQSLSAGSASVFANLARRDLAFKFLRELALPIETTA